MGGGAVLGATPSLAAAAAAPGGAGGGASRQGPPRGHCMMVAKGVARALSDLPLLVRSIRLLHGGKVQSL